MTNAVYSCWCFDGARVGRQRGRGGKQGERGPVKCRKKVGGSAVGVGVGESGFVGKVVETGGTMSKSHTH